MSETYFHGLKQKHKKMINPLEEYKNSTRKEKIKFWVILIGVIIICAIAFNHLLEVFYKVKLLNSPCELCEAMGNSCHATPNLSLDYSSFKLENLSKK